MRRQFGSSGGNRRPAQSLPGSKGRPTKQRGGGGNKGAQGSPEPTYLEVPTVTVTSSGATTTSGFKSQKAARAAKRRAQASRQRNQAVLHTITQRQQKPPLKAKLPKREPTTAPKVSRAAEDKAIRAALGPESKPITRATEGKLAKISRRGFEAEQGKKSKARPTGYTIPNPRRTKPLTPIQKHPQAVRKVKRQLRKLKAQKGNGGGELRSPIISTPAQSRVAKMVLRTGQQMGADRKEKLTALATGLQESRFAPSGAGWRGELSQYYANPEDLKQGARNFYNEAKSDSHGARGRGQTIHDFAQTIQASGAGASYYADNEPEARSLLKQFNQGQRSPEQKAKLKKVEAKAERLGLNPKAPNVGKPPKNVVTKFKVIQKAADALTKMKVPYVYGGGHGGGFESRPASLDCSSAVSWVLSKADVLDSPIVSGSMGTVLKPGPGAVTVFYNAGHTFMKIGDEYWGTSVGDSGAGGLGPHPAPSAAYLSEYSVGHVAGLGKKQALQLGINVGPATTQSFPGMSVSPSGTSATINTGAGTTQTQPGFSKKPITLAEQVARTTNKLKALGVGTEPPPEDKAAAISALEKKYGVSVV